MSGEREFFGNRKACLSRLVDTSAPRVSVITDMRRGLDFILCCNRLRLQNNSQFIFFALLLLLRFIVVGCAQVRCCLAPYKGNNDQFCRFFSLYFHYTVPSASVRAVSAFRSQRCEPGFVVGILLLPLRNGHSVFRRFVTNCISEAIKRP